MTDDERSRLEAVAAVAGYRQCLMLVAEALPLVAVAGSRIRADLQWTHLESRLSAQRGRLLYAAPPGTPDDAAKVLNHALLAAYDEACAAVMSKLQVTS